MAIQRLDHVSILSGEPEKVIAFYGDNLGFALESTVEMESMKIFYLKIGPDVIEIIQPLPAGTQASGGLKHVAFLSDDIEADFASFSRGGAAMVHKEIQRHGKVSFFFVKSPGGELVEIIQYS